MVWIDTLVVQVSGFELSLCYCGGNCVRNTVWRDEKTWSIFVLWPSSDGLHLTFRVVVVRIYPTRGIIWLSGQSNFLLMLFRFRERLCSWAWFAPIQTQMTSQRYLGFSPVQWSSLINPESNQPSSRSLTNQHGLFGLGFILVSPFGSPYLDSPILQKQRTDCPNPDQNEPVARLSLSNTPYPTTNLLLVRKSPLIFYIQSNPSMDFVSPVDVVIKFPGSKVRPFAKFRNLKQWNQPLRAKEIWSEHRVTELSPQEDPLLFFQRGKLQMTLSLFSIIGNRLDDGGEHHSGNHLRQTFQSKLCLLPLFKESSSLLLNGSFVS